ncbi:MAG: DUF6519 domain-containing protein [Acidobacteriaceae bacterium]
MSFDSSRFTFNPRRDFLGVVMEQGRVQLDSDWNEWQSEFARRIQAGTLDIFGPSGYPINITPNAFAIGSSSGSGGNAITIGTGRYYVDGLLAENHGTESGEAWDPYMAELSGAPYTLPAQPLPDSTIDYTQQPYYPNAPAVGAGPYLAYLDVWQREVTYLEEPWLIDSAVGVDTTGRLQTVWQVKLLDISGVSGGVACSTDIPAFDTLTQPSAARLTNGLTNNSPTGPCCLSPNTGFTGLENQLYRVEIHQGGATPTFKWSRDNASVATSVGAIGSVVVSGSSVSHLSVASLGRDAVLGFSNGNWIEITDDFLELNNLPGELVQIGSTGPGLTITLTSQLTGSFDATDASRHTRIVRWDQTATTTGDIPVPLDGSAVTLENGITVSFTANPTGGPFYSGDFWNFAARTADAKIQPLNAAPPRGIHHHYAKLGIVNFSGNPSDCRVPWPPTTSTGCGCTVDVSPSDFTSGISLQIILDQYKNLQTATEICLAPGTYNLPAPLRFTSAHSNITLKACQCGTAIVQAAAGQASQFSDGLVVLDNVTNVTLKGLQLIVPSTTFPASANFAGLSATVLNQIEPTVASGLQNLVIAIGVRPINPTNVTIKDCSFDLTSLGTNLASNSFPFGAAIFAAGQCNGLDVEDNQIVGAPIAAAQSAPPPTLADGAVPSAGTLSLQAGFLLVPAVEFNTPTAPSAPTWSFTYGLRDTAEETFAGTSVFQRAIRSALAMRAAQSVATTSAAKSAILKSSAVTQGVATTPVVQHPPTAQQPPAAQQPTTTAEPGVPTVAAGAPTVNEGLGDINVGKGITDINIGKGVFQVNPGSVAVGAAAASPTSLAAGGGNVLAAVLSNATFRNNSFNSLTAAAVVVGESEFVRILDNQVTACNAGLVVISPLQLVYLSILGLENIGMLVALSYPLPQGDTSTLTTIAAAPAPLYIYAGTANYTDSSNNVWIPDTTTSAAFSVSGGTLFQAPAGTTISEENNGGADPDATLYEFERFGSNSTSFTYTFNSLPTGYYQITLKFAELTWTAVGQRVFSVSINGTTVLNNFDIFQDSGGELIADDQVFANVVPDSNGVITIVFSPITDAPAVAAIAVVPQWNLNTASATTQANAELVSFWVQLEELAEQPYASLTLTPAQLRIEDNEIQALASPALLLVGDDSLINGRTGSLMMTGNRLSNTNFNQVAVAIARFGEQGSTIPVGDLGVLAEFAFVSTVAITQVTQCLVSSNMILNQAQLGVSCLLNDVVIPTPQLAVMSNLFNGAVGIFQGNYPAAQVPVAPIGCRTVLNTVLIGQLTNQFGD